MSFNELDRIGRNNEAFNQTNRNGSSGGGVFSDRNEAEVSKLTNVCIQTIFQISNNVAALQKMINQMGTMKDTTVMRQRIHELQESTRKLAKDTGKNIKNISTLHNRSENRQHKLQLQKLNRDFTVVLKKFEQIQKLAANKERETISLTRKNLSSHVDDEPLLDLDQSESAALLPTTSSTHQKSSHSHQLQASHPPVNVDEVLLSQELIHEREEGIRYIESTLMDVNEIFRDLGTVIQEQGGMLDNIESNIVNVRSMVSEGTEQLQTASKHQRKSRNKMCYFLFALICVAAVLSLVLYFTSR
eukprot:Sdes_comp15439_c0_seq1m4336